MRGMALAMGGYIHLETSNLMCSSGKVGHACTETGALTHMHAYTHRASKNGDSDRETEQSDYGKY